MIKRKFSNKLFIALCVMVFYSGIRVQAQKLVSGTVSAILDGKPIQGVSVRLSGSPGSTVTDAKGMYRISVPDGVVSLSFSYIGMRSVSEPINGRSIINVRLDDENSALQEIVVTAFGVEREKKAVGYSTQTIKGSELTEAREINVANSLKGKVAGVFVSTPATGPGGSSYVNIRGASSFQGNNQPLYVIDGVPMDNDNVGAPDLSNPVGQGRDYGDGIGGISPDDIESITVLKGPNGASLYGARGANGVILVTTKKGKLGARPKIEFNSNITYENPLVTPRRQNVYGPGWTESLDVAGWTLKTLSDGTQYYEMGTSFDSMWGPKMEGQLISVQLWPMLGVFEMTPKGRDEVAKFYKTGATFTNSAAISGGNEKLRFRASISDLRNKGIYPNSEYDRQTISTGGEYKATSKFTVESRVTYTKSGGYNRPGFGTNLNTVGMSLQRYPAFLSDEMLRKYKNESGMAENWADGRPFNPYWVANEFIATDSRDRINGYLTLRYQFTDWLNLLARGGTDFYVENRDSRIGVNTPTGGEGNLRRGQVNNDRLRMNEQNFDAILTSNGKLFGKFSGSASIGVSRRDRDLITTTLKGNRLNIDHMYNIVNAGIVVATNSPNKRRMNSVFFTGQLAYDNYLFMDITGRNDWSSTLAVGHQSFFYPSVSTSFVFTEAFDIPRDILSFGKVRFSVAQAGKDTSPYRTQIGYTMQSVGYGSLRQSNIGNNIPAVDLKNELTTSIETGLDLNFINNRLGIDFTYYNAVARNQILNVSIPAATGFSNKLINAGSIRNQGFEMMINGKIIQNKDYGWSASLNFSRNRSKVLSLYPDINSLNLFSTGETSIEARPGLPFGNIVGYRYKRNEAGQVVVSDKGTWLAESEPSVLGNIQPDYLAGLSTDFYYKGFSIGALIDMSLGGQVFSMSKFQQYQYGTAIQTEKGENLIAKGVIDKGNGVFVQNDIVIGRRAYYADLNTNKIAEEFVLDGSYIAFRELRVGYDIGRHFRKDSYMSSLKLSAVARNLFYIKQNSEMKEMGINPEGAYGPFTTAQGYEMTGIPVTRTIGFNLSFSL
jgi:TonB-linked SusC/RagA family outer membrane protein